MPVLEFARKERRTVAVTVQAYVVPGVSPLTVSGLEVPVPTTLPGLQVAVYKVMGLNGTVRIDALENTKKERDKA